jgi:adenosylcobyric acid synthase
LLPVETELKAPKVTTLTKFTWSGAHGSGYEIHMGQTDRKGGSRLFEVLERNGVSTNDRDGCATSDLKNMGTYIHGLFENPGVIRSWLDHVGLNDIEVPDLGGLEARDKEYDMLAEHFEKHIDIDSIIATVNINQPKKVQ